jgi:energy-coupling factor transport system substrate-specific component
MNSDTQKNKSRKPLTVYEISVFSMLGAIMYCSKLILEWAPNIHLLGMFTMAFTLVYKKKALIPIYVFVMLIGLFNGFGLWWIPYLYIWTILWAVTMLLPKKMSTKVAVPVYVIVCALHGLCYGTLYAPAQALMYGLDFKGMIAWIGAGLYFDLLHGIGNFALGFLIIPLSNTLKKAHKTTNINN